ncbi:SHOCT domain-containing protein, partial [Streptomyces sp. M10]
LRLVPRDGSAAPAARSELDPTCVVFGPGYGPVHESLPFAAAVLAAVRAAERTPESRPAEAARIPLRRDPADIAERIRHLGDLHQAGLVTDEEFVSKKTQLLSEL